MANPTCSASNCDRESISYSTFCGHHTNNGKLRKAILKEKSNSMTDVYWEEVELKKLVIENKHFAAGIFTNIDFLEVRFVNCGFSDCGFELAVFTSCSFENCELEKCSFTDVTFQESGFLDCRIMEGLFSEINMADESIFQGCDLDNCDFSGGIFSETGTISGNRFYNASFTQVSINQAVFQGCQFIESKFSKSTLYDSAFLNCHFNTISHDFKLSGPPILCDFRGSDFVNTAIPKSFRSWNNFKQHPAQFYGKVVQRMLKDEHPNHLKELGLALSHLQKFPGIDELSIRLDVASLFKRLAAEAAHSGNYQIIGEILSAYGRIPENFRGPTGFFLPPASSDNGLEPGQARLIIRVELDRWTVARVSALLSMMAEMETLLPEGMPQEIDYMEKGSLIIEILGSLKPLLGYFQALLDFKKSSYELKLKGYELESKQIDLEYHRDMRQNELQRAAQELEKNDIELAHRRLDLMERIKEKTGYDHLDISKTKKGKKAEQLASAIKKEFPVIHLKLEE